MLNTSLHNPNVKNKVSCHLTLPPPTPPLHAFSPLPSLPPPLTPPLLTPLTPPLSLQPTLEQFISMNRDINDGKDLPPELLQVSLALSLLTLC